MKTSKVYYAFRSKDNIKNFLPIEEGGILSLNDNSRKVDSIFEANQLLGYKNLSEDYEVVKVTETVEVMDL
jgi:hypothetical protein